MACKINISFSLQPTIAAHSLLTDGEEFRFLNQSKIFPGGNIDWLCSDMGKLWRYNLHYFDYLLIPGLKHGVVKNLVDGWIEGNCYGKGDGWEPYTTSLRIVNWIKKLSLEKRVGDMPEKWAASLYAQANWLDHNIEHHILANHYLKNAKALIYSGAYFKGGRAAHFLRKGMQIFSQELNEQILDDGGHCERSPMYHCIVVEDILDVLNLLISNEIEGSEEMVLLARKKAVRALDYLRKICFPDVTIPLFNDSAYGVAPSPQDLFDYGERIVDYQRVSQASNMLAIEMRDSGYYVMRDRDDMLVIDCGPIGPSYQPGHSHCDLLSFELVLDGRRVVVDSGVHDYENTETRRYARSTRAHNTVVVDEQEQSDVWGVFRVGRRAKPLYARLDMLGGTKIRFEGAHDGYRFLPGGVVHMRTVEYSQLDGWTVRDEIQGGGEHRMDSYLHLDPEIHAELSDNCIRLCSADSNVFGQIQVLGQATISIEKGWHFPEFGVSYWNDVVKISVFGALPIMSGYRIAKC